MNYCLLAAQQACIVGALCYQFLALSTECHVLLVCLNLDASLKMCYAGAGSSASAASTAPATSQAAQSATLTVPSQIKARILLPVHWMSQCCRKKRSLCDIGQVCAAQARLFAVCSCSLYVFSTGIFTAEVLAQGKNVKSIIDDWNNELNAHSRAFVADAQSLAEWDQHIRRKRRELLEMEAHLSRVRLQQHLLSALHMHRNADFTTT